MIRGIGTPRATTPHRSQTRSRDRPPEGRGSMPSGGGGPPNPKPEMPPLPTKLVASLTINPSPLLSERSSRPGASSGMGSSPSVEYVAVVALISTSAGGDLDAVIVVYVGGCGQGATIPYAVTWR